MAGFHTWKQLQRSVNKGEKAISILAPLRYKQEVEDPKTGDTTQQFGIRGFKKVSVFDISQTIGEDLPLVPVSPLHGDDQGLFEQLQQFSTHRGWSVQVEPLGGANGVCRFRSQTISIDPKLSPLHRAKTLAHEIAHSLLHEEAQYTEHRGDMELEAESVAFIVLDHFGLDSGVVLQKMSEDRTILINHRSLCCYSENLRHEFSASFNISFCHSFNLSFTQHIHRFKSS